MGQGAGTTMNMGSKTSPPLQHFYGVILGGGAGTRLWPLSRELSPKQILHLFGQDSLIRQTIYRLQKLIPQERIFIVTSERLSEEIRNHLLAEYPPLKQVHFILEPAPRNTAPAVALAAWQLVKKDPQTVLGIFPSDHFITHDEPLLEAIARAYRIAQKGYLVTFGLRPQRPETGYGYIEQGAPIDSSLVTDLSSNPSLATNPTNLLAYHVLHFHEKPDLPTAQAFLQNGRHFWNSGMFVFQAKTLLEEVQHYLPELIETFQTLDRYTPEEHQRFAEELFQKLIPISLDHGILEKSDKVAVLPIEIGWRDVGSLPSLDEFHPKDEKGNVQVGHVLLEDCHNTTVYSDSRLVATIGLEDLMVIDTRDATLVCPKARAQEVSKIVVRLKEEGAEESVSHRSSLRPWGSFVELEKGSTFQVKHIQVLPGMRLSEQLHNHRSEHWIILAGAAKVYLDGHEQILHANESIYIPTNTRHRLENPGKIPVRLIEVQNGEYLGEDDIERFADDYGRGEL